MQNLPVLPMIEPPSSAQSIGLCADIHGTYIHVLRMQKQSPGVSHWFCAGEVVDMGKTIQPAPRVLSQRDIPSVMGNHDYRFKERHLHRIDDETQPYLDQLPFGLDIRFAGNQIRIYHATSESREDLALERAGNETFRALFSEEEADIIGLGHTHKPYVKTVGSTRFINPGALGLPEEEPPSYCVLSRDGEAEIVYLEEGASER